MWPRVSAYIGIARPDHWIKNIFLLPGLAAGLMVGGGIPPALPLLAAAITGMASLCLAASANYTINEFLDAGPDRHHPVKRHRAGALGLLDWRAVAAQYLLLAAGGVFLASLLSVPFLLTTAALLAMGLIYNVPPLRSKDRAYVDVLSESVNNPLRFLLGWFLVLPLLAPPASVLFGYWMGGAFLMAVKRYSELRGIRDRTQAGLYRRSFRRYTENSLLLSSFFYAVATALFLAIFLIKYRIEFILTFPLFATLFTWYLAIGLRADSAAQAPEKLYREVPFMAFAGFTFAAAGFLFFFDVPWLRIFTETHLLHIR